MKTLRDEWFVGARCVHNGESCTSHTRRLLGKYGNYRVVEGFLEVEKVQDLGYRVFLNAGSEMIHLGNTPGMPCHLLLPPEEKCPQPDWELTATAQRARADKYEAALMEIAAVGSPFEAPHRDDACWLAAERFRIAREALDDE